MKRILVLASAVVLSQIASGVSLAQEDKASVVAAITKIENDEIKADLTNDMTFYRKILADDWMGGDSDGVWYTKADILKQLADPAKNKTNKEEISDLKVRVYGSTAIATYTDSYDALVNGEHQVRTIIATDTFVKIGGEWKAVASHACKSK
jgi:phosphoenolpyruvate carboxylase